MVSAASIIAQAARTASACSAARSPFGSQRRQARNPAASAAATPSKKRVLRRSGRREGQPGRQNTPCVVTP
jgi:hypothetical protein